FHGCDDGQFYAQPDGRVYGTHPVRKGRLAHRVRLSDHRMQYRPADRDPGHRGGGSPGYVVATAPAFIPRPAPPGMGLAGIAGHRGGAAGSFNNYLFPSFVGVEDIEEDSGRRQIPGLCRSFGKLSRSDLVENFVLIFWQIYCIYYPICTGVPRFWCDTWVWTGLGGDECGFPGNGRGPDLHLSDGTGTPV